jgi:hypothetical protein
MWERLWGRAARYEHERVAAALRVHPLLPLVVDPAWYVARYRDVLAAGLDAVDHLLGPGLVEGRDPGPFVDLSFVRTQRPGPTVDGAALLLELLDHGLADGWRPSPYVDPAWYAAEHTDVPDEPVAALRHLIEVGFPEGRAVSPFVDLRAYAIDIPDIASGGVDPFLYFTALGQHLARFPHPAWDESGYLDANEYVRFALGMGKHLHGFEHFCATGHAEVARGAILLPVRLEAGRPGEEFAEARYLAANPDVAELVASGELPDGVTHFFAIGHREVLAGRRRIAPPTTTARLEPATPVAAAAPRRSVMGFVHHDVDGAVDPHVLTAIDTYLAAGIDVHVVSSRVDAEGREALAQRGVPLHLRSHNDDLRDFGAWNLLLAHLGMDVLEHYERVILANDSVYFPVRDPEPFFAALHGSDADVWSATDSFAGGRYHLQSYFLALAPAAVRVLVPELARRAEAHPSPTKLGLIQWFEIGLSQFAADAGLRLGAFHSVADIRDEATLASLASPHALSQLAVTVTNQTHHFWRAANASGLPTLKVDLLRDNPLPVDIEGWQDAIDGPCTSELIEAHLARVRR